MVIDILSRKIRKYGATELHNKHICHSILQYLLDQKNQEDSLDGLILAAYDWKIEELAQEIARNVGYLIQQGFVQEVEDRTGKKKYKLKKSKEELREFLDKTTG